MPKEWDYSRNFLESRLRFRDWLSVTLIPAFFIGMMVYSGYEMFS